MANAYLLAILWMMPGGAGEANTALQYETRELCQQAASTIGADITAKGGAK